MEPEKCIKGLCIKSRRKAQIYLTLKVIETFCKAIAF